MAEYSTRPDMDRFLINPTYGKGVDYVRSESPNNASGDLIPIFLPDEVLTVKSGKKPLEPVGTFRTFANESLFAQGYASEEEAGSPVDDNDFGFHSTSDTESTASIRISESLEDLCDHANALQLCSKAQTVQVISVGKAKVVSVPKMGDIFGNDTPSESPRSSSDKYSASSSFQGQQAQPNVIRRKPNLPPLQAVSTSVAPRSNRNQTPLAQQRADFARHDSFSPNTSNGTPTSASPTKRKLPKLSSTLKLKAFGRPSRSDSSASRSTEGSEGRMDWWSVTSSPISPDTRDIPRAVSKPLPKMVARGASERAPPLVLPPCPHDYNDDWDVGYASQWPLKDDGYGSQWPLRDDSVPPNALKQLRRKSVAAVFATAQA